MGLPKKQIVKSANLIKNNLAEKVQDFQISPEAVICTAVKIPGVRIDREKFLRKEFIGHYSEETITKAIAFNPAIAGIPKEDIAKYAKQVISYETAKVSTISFAAGIPGGVAMAATIPADLAQYFGFIIRIMQELAYLYGFSEFNLDGDDLNSETMNEIMIFLGVMFGVNGATTGLKYLAKTITKQLEKTIAKKALTKGTLYPLIKNICKQLGIKMTKDLLIKVTGKVVPVIGGVASGGLSYVTFKPCANRLKKSFEELNLSDPHTYESDELFDDAIDAEISEIVED